MAGIVIFIVAVTACVWGVAHTAQTRGRSPTGWGAVTLATALCIFGVAEVVVAALARSNAAYSSTGTALAVGSVLLAPLGIALATTGLIAVLRRGLEHGSASPSNTLVLVRHDAWPEPRVMTMVQDPAELVFRSDNDDDAKPGDELQVPWSTVEDIRVDGEYLDVRASNQRLSLTGWGEAFAERRNKIEFVCALEAKFRERTSGPPAYPCDPLSAGPLSTPCQVAHHRDVIPPAQRGPDSTQPHPNR